MATLSLTNGNGSLSSIPTTDTTTAATTAPTTNDSGILGAVGSVANSAYQGVGNAVYNAFGNPLGPLAAPSAPAVIPASSISKSVTPVGIPQSSTPTADGALTAHLDSVYTPPPDTTVNNGIATANPAPPPNPNSAIMDRLNSLNASLGTKGDVTSQLNSQFGVDEKQQAYIDAYNQYNAKKLSYQQQVDKIYGTPGITREQAQQQVNEVSRVNNADLANLAVITQAAQGNFQGAMDTVKRKLDAQFEPIQTQIDNLGKFVQLNNADLTDSEKTQLENKRFQLQNNLDQLKSAKQNAHQFALQQGITDQNVLNAIDAAQSPADVYAAVGGDNKGLPATGNSQISNVNSAYQPYISQLKDGTSYVNQESLKNLTPFQQQEAARQFAQAGIKVLPADKSDKLDNINVTKDNLDQLQGLVDKKLGSGISGRVTSGIGNKIKELLQSDPEISAFNSYRDTAINTIQALAGGSGSGFRLNQTEIDTAVGNLPKLTDNIETATQKIKNVKSFLDRWENQLLPKSQTGSGNSAGDGLYNF